MAEQSINILDCTLRDGGYVNNWSFDDFHIVYTVSELKKAKIDIIECGFLDQSSGKDQNSTRFNDIHVLNKLLASDLMVSGKSSEFVAMIEAGKYDVTSLPVCHFEKKGVTGIRYSFRRSDVSHISNDLSALIHKGYKVFVQPISTISYSDQELKELLVEVNALNIYAVYIVDTQGVMFKDDLLKRYQLFDKMLDGKVKIGFHSHNNLQLSYSNAIDFIEMARGRNIILDSSVYGMGRGAGNLHTELLADFINRKIGLKYDVDRILDLIDKYYYPLFNIYGWGYSLGYFLSGSIGVYPDYALFLLNKKHLSVVNIKKILSIVPKAHAYEFNKGVIESLYYEYNASTKLTIQRPVFDPKEKFLLIASGSSVKEKSGFIAEHKNVYGAIISLNHIPAGIPVHFCFFNSQRRYDEFSPRLGTAKAIITSNVVPNRECFVLDYEQLITLDNSKNDNSAIMFMNYLMSLGIEQVSIAGLDGFNSGGNNYSYKEYDGPVDDKAFGELNEYIASGLKSLARKIKIEFLTESIFKRFLRPRVIGVIPSRMESTRLSRKSLKDICGMPMVAHVLKRAQLASILDEVYVATDSDEIKAAVERYGGKVMMTSPDHENGILRMHEVSTKVYGDIFVLINGDELLIEPEDITASVKGLLAAEDAAASLLVTKYGNRNDIPSDARGVPGTMWKAYHCVSFRKKSLDYYAQKLHITDLERRETHDMLRMLEEGSVIQEVIVERDCFRVDSQDDLDVMNIRMKENKLFQEYKEA